MQVQKEEVRNKILEVAEVEFMKNGFQGTSMRKISKLANVNLGNIYNYFSNKDDILRTVLQPFFKEVDKIVQVHSDIEDIRNFFSIEHQQEIIEKHVEFITKHRQQIYLLLYKSQGSSLELFRDYYTDKETEHFLILFQRLKQVFPNANTSVSDFFIHICASWEINIFGEIVSHDVSTDDIRKFIEEYVTFSINGWKALILE